MHLARLFQRSVHKFADRPALVRGMGDALPYRALARRVHALARHLRDDLGLQAGDRVCLAMKNCEEYAEAMLAIWHARLCAVPVNSKLHAAEVRFILQDAGARVCLAHGEFLRELAAADAHATDVQWIDVADAPWQAARHADAPAEAEAAAQGADDEPAWLFYTSGTTGRPKGVVLTHANLVHMALNFHADMLAIGADDAIVHVAPLSHGSGLYAIPYWMHGGLQVIPESGGFDEAELAALLRHHRNASLFAAPTIITRMVRHQAAHPGPLPGLRCLLAGGAPFYAQDIKAAVACFGPRIAQMYGQGETPMTISALPADFIARAVAQDDQAMLSSVGFAQSTVDIDILGDDGARLPVGAIGEIVVRSPTVMAGYWNNAAASAGTLRGGALWTGDVGLIDERGLLHLKDRSKDVIISGGSNIYPREVEDVLLAHPGVREAAVIGAPDAEWGEVVVAIVVADGPVTEASLDAHCLASIARFKRPKRYAFVDALPKNPTGKVLKSQLRARHGGASS